MLATIFWSPLVFRKLENQNTPVNALHIIMIAYVSISLLQQLFTIVYAVRYNIAMSGVNIYSLTLALDGWKPRIWRRIWVRDDIPLPALSTALYQSMGWCGCHMSEFRLGGKIYGDCSEDPPDNWLDWTKYTLRDIVKPSSKYLHYCYDFGDIWQLTATIKRELEHDLGAPYPVCVNGKNAAPPEDVGSYSGFERFIKIMNNPKHREYKEMAEWYCDDTFDPRYFSVDEVNDFIQDPEEYDNEYREYIKRSLRI